MTLHAILAECQSRIAAGDTADYPNPFESLQNQRPLIQCQRAKCGKMFRPKRPSQRYCDVSCQVGNWNDKQHALVTASKAAQVASATPQSETIGGLGREATGTAETQGEQFV